MSLKSLFLRCAGIVAVNVLCMLFAYGIVLPTFLFAQPPVVYKPWPVDPAQDARKQGVFTALERGNFDANRQDNEKFFKTYYFARWTDAANEQKLYTFRNEFCKTDTARISGNARNYLLGYALTQLGAIATEKTIFPAGRFNAILAIGMLDQKPGEGSARPAAYPEALTFLVKEYENTKNEPFIRLGARLGIVRHAQTGIENDAQKQAVFNLFRKIIEEGKPNEERNADAQELLDWHRALAVDALQSLRMVGANAAGVETLLGIAQDDAEAAELRFQAIRALGDLDYEAAKADNITVPFSKIAQTVGSLAKFLCEHEQKKIQDLRFLDPTLATQFASAGGGMGMDMSMAMSMGGPMDVPSFSGSSGMDGMPGGTSLSKGQVYVEHSIGRLKYACNSIRNCIMGRRSLVSSADNATGIQGFLEAEEMKKMQAVARDLQAFTDLLDLGPPTPAVGMGSGATPIPTETVRGRQQPEIKPPKVTFADIVGELQKLTLKFSELFG